MASVDTGLAFLSIPSLILGNILKTGATLVGRLCLSLFAGPPLLRGRPPLRVAGAILSFILSFFSPKGARRANLLEISNLILVRRRFKVNFGLRPAIVPVVGLVGLAVSLTASLGQNFKSLKIEGLEDFVEGLAATPKTESEVGLKMGATAGVRVGFKTWGEVGTGVGFKAWGRTEVADGEGAAFRARGGTIFITRTGAGVVGRVGVALIAWGRAEVAGEGVAALGARGGTIFITRRGAGVVVGEEVVGEV